MSDKSIEKIRKTRKISFSSSSSNTKSSNNQKITKENIGVRQFLTERNSKFNEGYKEINKTYYEIDDNKSAITKKTIKVDDDNDVRQEKNKSLAKEEKQLLSFSQNKKPIPKNRLNNNKSDEEEILGMINKYFKYLTINIIKSVFQISKSNGLIIHEVFNLLNLLNSIEYNKQIHSIIDNDSDEKIEISLKEFDAQRKNPCYDIEDYISNMKLRKVKIFKINNKDFLYSYIPVMCSNGIACRNISKCIYSHCQNEILYHPLQFKTSLCMDIYHDELIKNNFFSYFSIYNLYSSEIHKNQFKLCPFSHSLETDFRIIYDINDKSLQVIMNKTQNVLNKYMLSYEKYYSLDNSKFDKTLFKVKTCFNGLCWKEDEVKRVYSSIGNDNDNEDVDDDQITRIDLQKTCCGIHNPKKKEDISKIKRRPEGLFRYNPIECIDHKRYLPCGNGDFCMSVHNKNEKVYHSEIFRRKVKCNREKSIITSACIYIDYYDSCYGFHDSVIDKRVVNMKCDRCKGFFGKKGMAYMSKCKHKLCKGCYDFSISVRLNSIRDKKKREISECVCIICYEYNTNDEIYLISLS